MDSKLFRVTTQPNYYPEPPAAVVRATSYSQYAAQRSAYSGPAPDARFPGWAATQEDGRLITDYRPRCAVNIPSSQQFSVQQWSQRNAESIIELSRARNTKETGAGRGFDVGVVAPPAQFVTCDTFQCRYTPTGKAGGIGTERAESVPHLFGTFNTDVLPAHQPLPQRSSTYEGGRNSPRGRQYSDLGTGGVQNINKGSTYLA